MTELEPWSVQKSRTLYGIENWGGDYFDINEKGNICVRPNGPDGAQIDLDELVQAASDRAIAYPLLFRFNGILRHRVQTVCNAFARAMTEYEYSGKYLPAYPIKVNQQRQVVDIIRTAGKNFSMGLEVGSKPELIAVLGIEDATDSLLLCNGYKDESYIELVLTAKKLGRQPIIIIEKLTELPMVLDVAEAMDVTPEIGLRLKLTGRGAGRWEKSGGDRAKFGLTISEIVSAVALLRRREKLDIVRLIHFHAGSQLTEITPLKTALKEAGQVYVQLQKDCPNLNMLDVGGGLGVDYDGSKTNFSSSMNYTLDEYARDVVWLTEEICKQADVRRPDIITESGRATVAHHSVLVFDVLGIANTFESEVNFEEVLATNENNIIKNFAYLLRDLSPKNCQETLHDAVSYRNDLTQQFNMGLVAIEDRALGDRIYWAILQAVCKASKQLSYLPEDLESLPEMLTDTYFCNFSVFQSMPDSWAIQQIFPITPVSNLEEKPEAKVVLADITCDSDGAISRFVDLRDVKPYLPAHRLKQGERYYFAAFLVGAYQEILGDLHNLFGDTNAIHVEMDDSGNVEFSEVIEGDCVEEVLKYVQFEKHDLCLRWRRALETAAAQGKLTTTELGEMYHKYSSAFEEYTYLSQRTK